jgi:hypothetical protein
VVIYRRRAYGSTTLALGQKRADGSVDETAAMHSKDRERGPWDSFSVAGGQLDHCPKHPATVAFVCTFLAQKFGLPFVGAFSPSCR